jgi:hypothetical protein
MVADMLKAAMESGEMPSPEMPAQESAPNREAESLVIEQPPRKIEAPKREARPAVQMIDQERYKEVSAPVSYEAKSALKIEVENLLADKEMVKIYQGLEPKDQKIMKDKGEKLANWIVRSVERDGKLSSYKALAGVKDFMKAPKISHWYLLQKTKIVHDTLLNKVEKVAKIV